MLQAACWPLLLVLAACALGVRAQTCTVPPPNYINISLSNWGWTPGSTYPIGYQIGSFQYLGTLCLTVSNSASRVVEIMAEGFNQPLCVQDLNGPAGPGSLISTCDGSGLLNLCFLNAAANLQFFFYCAPGHGCGETGESFYYRIRLGPQGMSSEEYCLWYRYGPTLGNTTVYPSSLDDLTACLNETLCQSTPPPSPQNGASADAVVWGLLTVTLVAVGTLVVLWT